MNTTLRALLRSLALTAYCLCALAFLVLAAPMCAAATYYVSNGNGNDSGPGTQSTPFLTIQQGIVSSASGDTVVVEAGTYTGPKNVDIDLDGRNITLTTDTGDPMKTTIDCMGTSSTYHRGFYLHNGEGTHGTLVINGFTVKNGYEGNGNNNVKGGGGMYVGSSDTVTVQNCTFTANTTTGVYGGGISNDGGQITLINCSFSGNTTDQTGGGLYNGGTVTNMTNCSFTGNTANRNGGGFGSSGTVTVTGCKFTNNTAGSYFARGGGGAYSSGAVVVQTSTFSGNTATNAGGGLSNDTGILTLMSCTFSGNTATKGYGGGLDNNAGSNSGALSVTNCVFTKNNAPNSYGGGISLNQYFTSNDTATIANCLIVSNTAGTTGGGVDNNAGVLTLEFSTLSGNVATGSGGGIYNSSATSALTDDILYDDNGGEAVDGTSGQTAIMASYCDILGGYAGTGVFDKNPLFVNPAAGDFHLKTGSPCIGKGTPITGVTTDLDGKTRGNPPTIGAYEGAVVAVTSHTHILWTNPDGRAVLWDSDANGAYTDHGQYGPYTDSGGTWKAVALATGPNGVSRLLWANPDGRMVLWYVNPDGTHGDGGQYGPYPDAGGVWRATTVSVGPDNLPHILWTNPDGREVLWDGNAGGTYTDHGQYGPYTDSSGTWRAVTAAIGPDNLPHLLWDNPEGRSVLWNGNPDGTYSDHGQYGPYTDAGGTWNAITACVGPDNLPHLLWNNPDGRAVLWNGNAGGTYNDHGQYGPYTDSGGTWKAAAVAVGPDDLTHLLWNNPDGRAVLWDGNAGGTYNDHGQYGPYTDSGGTWRATATSAGP